MKSKAVQAVRVAAAGCLAVAGAARSGQVSLGSPGRHAAVPVYAFVRPDAKSVFPTSDSAHVKLDKETLIGAWALIDEANCVELGTSHPFIFNPTSEGTFRNDIEPFPLGDGNCPGVDFDFATIHFTWTDRSAPQGARVHDRGASLITGIDKKVYGIYKVSIVDKVNIKFTGR